MSVLGDALTKLTLFPNGVGQGVVAIIGGVAGDLTVTGIKTTDTLLAVQSIAFNAGVPSAVVGLLDEFTISADDTINNDDGTTTANMIVLVTVAAGLPR